MMKRWWILILIAVLQHTSSCFALSIYKDSLISSVGFIENKGQIVKPDGTFNQDVLFLLPLADYNVLLRKNGFSYEFRRRKESSKVVKEMLDSFKETNIPVRINYTSHRIDFDFLNSNSSPEIIKSDKGKSVFHYYTTGTGSGITKVNHFQKIEYKDIYSGVNIEFLYDMRTRSFKYNFKAISSQALNAINLCITGGEHALADSDKIKIITRYGEFYESIPYSLGETGDTTITLNGFFMPVNDSVYTIRIKEKFSGKITIDPVPLLIWATYYGGTDDDCGYGIMIDQFDSVYISGYSLSANNIASIGAHQQTYSGSLDGIIAKLNTSGQLVWGTYMGGTDSDNIYSIAQFDAGHFVVSGYTSSTTNISTPGSFQPTYQGGSQDAFLAKFTLNGLLVWSTYFGGAVSDQATSVTCSSSGDIFIAGDTDSPTSIATAGTFQTVLGGTLDGFIAKFSSSGNFLTGTYFGGTAIDQIYHLAINSSNQIIFSGTTFGSSGLGVNSLYQNSFAGGIRDGFFGTFDASLNLLWSNYFGGTADDITIASAVIPGDTIFICGYTGSLSGIASIGAYQTAFGGGMHDSYAAKFNPDGSLAWSTYIGGDEYDELTNIGYHSNGNLYLCGYSFSTTGFSTPNALQPNLYQWPDSHDCALVKLSPSGNIIWATYYGGEADDELYDVAFDSSGDIYVTGQVLSENNISTLGVHQEILGNSSWTADAVVIRFSENTCPPLFLQISANTPVCENDSLFLSIPSGYTYQWTGPDGYNNTAAEDTLAGITPLQAGIYHCTVTDTNGCSYTFTDTISVFQNYAENISISICSGDSIFFANNYVFAPGVYYDSMFTVNGCDSIRMLSLTVNSPLITFDLTSPLCFGDTIVISTIENYAGFNWSGPGSISSNLSILTITPSDSGSQGYYLLTATDSSNCTVTDSIFVTVPPPLTSTTQVQQPVCGNANGAIIVHSTGGTGNYLYNWNPAVTQDSMSINLSSGTYWITVTDQNACTENIQVMLIDSGQVSGTFNCTDYCEFLPYTALLTYSSSISSLNYQWIIDGNDTIFGNNQNYIFTASGSHTILLIASNGQGCSDTVFCSSYLLENNGFMIPNVFSPNSDDLNDVFAIDLSCYRFGHVEVYNRWGQLLWESEIPAAWQGIGPDAEPVPEGTYYYIVRLTDFSDQPVVYTGHVTLLR